MHLWLTHRIALPSFTNTEKQKEKKEKKNKFQEKEKENLLTGNRLIHQMPSPKLKHKVDKDSSE